MRQRLLEKHFHAEVQKKAEQRGKKKAFLQGTAAAAAGGQHGKNRGRRPSEGRQKQHPEQTGSEKPDGPGPCGGSFRSLGRGGKKKRAEQKSRARASRPEPRTWEPCGKSGRRGKKGPCARKHEQSTQGVTAHRGG